MVWPAETAAQRIEDGIPFSALAAFLKDVDRDSVLEALRMSKRTFERRREQGRLLPDESDRFYRLVQLYALATDVLGDTASARDWMSSPAVAFAGRQPLEIARNEAGARQIEDLLLRIEHGVYN